MKNRYTLLTTILSMLACFGLLPQAQAESNTAYGDGALVNVSTGCCNTAIGSNALLSNTTGSFNTAVGRGTLYSFTSGNGNIAIGEGAGNNLTTGDQNIYIGNLGNGSESNTIRIGSSCTNCGPGGSTGPHTATFIAGIRDVTTANADAVAVVIDSAGAAVSAGKIGRAHV